MNYKPKCRAISVLMATALMASITDCPERAAAEDHAGLPPLGVVIKERGTVCFSIEQAKLPIGEQVSLILLIGTPQAIVSGKISGPGGSCSQFPGMTSYTLRTTPVKLPDIVVAVGALTPFSHLHMRGKSAVLTASGEPPLVFRSCPSAEGFHVTAWGNTPLTGPLIWHRYVYSNQDLEATCSDKETQIVGGNNG